MNGYYFPKELTKLGISFGKNVQISRLTQIYCSELVIGDNVRIDDFCVLTGRIKIGSYIHIANYCGLYGNGEIQIDDFAGISSKCTIYSASDDFSGDYLTGVHGYTNPKLSKVHLMKHTIIGTGSTILPGVTLNMGAGLGAMSLATKSIPTFQLYVGQPARFLKNRRQGCLAIEEKIRNG